MGYRVAAVDASKWNESRGVARSRQRRGFGMVAWFAVAMLAAAPVAPAHAIPMLTLSVAGGGPDGAVPVGQQVAVEVFASGIPAGSDGLGMFGFGFGIAYDDTGLDVSDLQLGPLWILTGFDDSRNDPGDVGLLSNRFFQASGPFGDDILLGTILFEGLAEGVYDLDVSFFTGVGDNVLFDGTILDATPSYFTNGSIQVIPEPSTLALVAFGATLLAALRRRVPEV